MSRAEPGPGGAARSSRARRALPTAIAAAAGAGIAGAYAWFVGCRTGTCPLTSNPWIASLYGALVGTVVAWPAGREGGGSAREPQLPHPAPQGAAAPPER